MKRSKTKTLSAKRVAKATRMAKPGFKSNYAKKRIWCRSNNVWGFEVPAPKPWK
jgi:hypothetical protein